MIPPFPHHSLRAAGPSHPRNAVPLDRIPARPVELLSETQCWRAMKYRLWTHSSQAQWQLAPKAGGLDRVSTQRWIDVPQKSSERSMNCGFHGRELDLGPVLSIGMDLTSSFRARSPLRWY